MVCKALVCLFFCRCCRCVCQRYRHCVVILRPELAPSSASPRPPAYISCSLLKFRYLCQLESQVEYGFILILVYNRLYRYLHVLTCLVLVQAIQLICPVCICYMETPLPKPGLTSHRKCLSPSPICMQFSTSHISPGKFY